MLFDFIAEPTATPDLACSAEIVTDFELPGTATAGTPWWSRIEAELAIVPITPLMWRRMADARRAR
jgi:hypothetical protein